MTSAKGAHGALLALLIAIVTGCQSPWVHRFRCPSPLRSVETLGADRELRTRARIERGSRRAVLDLVIEKSEERLVVMARNELGVIAFVAALRGREIDIPRSLPDRFLPLAPRALLHDIQTVFFSDPDPRKKEREETTISRCGYRIHFSRDLGDAS